MADKKQVEKVTISMYAASEELAMQLIKLQRAKSFVRVGKDWADMLFKSGVEAGALLSGISELCDRQAKIDAANQAVIKLNQTMYLANIMRSAGFYTTKQIAPLLRYVGKLLNGLRELLASVPATRRVIRVENPAAFGGRAAQPVVVPPVVVSADGTVLSPSGGEVKTAEDDGFGDGYDAFDDDETMLQLDPDGFDDPVPDDYEGL